MESGQLEETHPSPESEEVHSEVPREGLAKNRPSPCTIPLPHTP